MIKANSLSKASLWVCVLACLIILFGKPLMTDMSLDNLGGRIMWDIFGYYLYLPATFIYHDPLITDISWFSTLFDTYQPSSTPYQIWSAREGTQLIKYSMGMAILYLPWFLIGHLFAFLTGAPMDGMSDPYQYAVATGSFVYVFIGIFYLRKILVRLFSERLAILGIVLVVLGTNFLQISTNNTLTPHPYQFTLYALVFWNVIRWYDTREKKFLYGFAVFWAISLLARPSSFVLFPIVAYWQCANFSDIKIRTRWWFKEGRKNLIKVAIVMFVVALPQMVYWMFTTGKPLFYSYQSDGFDFLTPYIAEVLWSYRKGWWLYTPIMILSLIGLLPLWKNNKSIGLPMAMFWFFNLYVVSSWNCWWYGGSFGHRAFIDAYPLYMVSIVAFVQWVWTKNWIAKLGTSVLVTAFCVLNLFQSWQMNHWMISDTHMTEKYYWAIFGKTSTTPEDRMYLGLNRHPDTKFDRSLPYELVLDTTVSGIEDDPQRWGPGNFNFQLPMEDVSLAEHTWWEVKVKSNVVSREDAWLRVQSRHDHDNTKTKEYLLCPADSNECELYVEYLSPILKADRDYIRLYVVSDNDQPIEVKELSVKVYAPTWY